LTFGAWPYPRLIAHRGGGTLAPENTLAALRMAAQRAFRGVEFDVMLSADGTPILIHDETLERTTNGIGRVCETGDAQLARLDAGSWFGARFAGVAIPTFADAAELCLALGLWANVEIKPARGAEAETGGKAAAIARELWAGSALPPVLSSFSPVALEAARAAAPELPRGMLCGAVPPDWREQIERLGCVSLHCDARKLAPGILAQANAAGIPVVIYTVNALDEAERLLRLGAAALITDRIDLLPPDLA
jgi:glycerophosphoryl diester phosphodiesterase